MIFPGIVIILFILLGTIILKVEVWRKQRVDERQYETSYKWLAEKSTQGILCRLFNMCGAQHRKLMFIVWQFIYTTITILIGYCSYHRYVFLPIALCAIFRGFN